MGVRSGMIARQVSAALSRRLLMPALIALIGIFYLGTLRPGNDWGGDFSAYVQHAANLVEGRPYVATHYVHAEPGLGPRAYPPLYPLLLAPVYALRGVDLQAFKIANILFFLLFLLVLDRTLGLELPRQYRLALLAVVGLNPWFWYLKDHVLPSFPFLLLLFSSLYLIEARPRTPLNTTSAFRAMAAGAVAYLAFATWVGGFAVVPALIARDLLAARRLRGTSLVTLTTFGILASIQTLLFGSLGYLEQVEVGLGGLVRGLGETALAACLFFDSGGPLSLCLPLFAVFAVLVVLGYLTRWRAGCSVYEAFFPFLGALILAWPYAHGFRVLLPLFVLGVFYALLGFRSLSAVWLERRRGWFGGALMALVLLTYGGKYAQLEHGPFEHGVNSAEATELFAHVRNATSDSDLILFRKPRVLALFAHRRSAVYPRPFNADEFRDLRRRLAATHLIVGRLDREPIHRFVAGAGPELVLEFENRDFRFFRFETGPERAEQ